MTHPQKLFWCALMAVLLCGFAGLATMPAAGAQVPAEDAAALNALSELAEGEATLADEHAVTQAVVKTRPYQILLLFTFVLAIFLGVELISKVPSQLHTPLMSGANAISGITIVGALLAAGQTEGRIPIIILGFLAVVCATINVVGGYLVTNRMLAMFKHKEGK
jgi:NAD(P) transhydrogenase subunit alpha